MKKIAVVLCGSGYLDGSEIRESVAVLCALSRYPVSVHSFAPDDAQAEVVNCLTGKVDMSDSRNMLVEASRIARGNIQSLQNLNPKDYDGLIMPGGFGAAKNLCTFAKEGAKGSVRADLKAILASFYASKKPIGAVCIAPAVLALSFPGQAFELTLGSQSEATAEIEKLGHQHFVKAAHECHVDQTHRIVTSPAYMMDQAPLHEIFTGIDLLVKRVMEMAGVLHGV